MRISDWSSDVCSSDLPRATFGPLAIRGSERVEEDYLRRLVPWKPGDLYEQRKIDEYRSRLLGTGLFETALIDIGKHVPPGGSLPLTARLSEGEHRSVGIGASYSSTDGFGGTIFWEIGRATRLNSSH